MTPLTQLLAAAALSVVICIALWQSRGVVDSKDVTVGGFVSFITAMLMLIAPIRRLADVANPITRGVAALERGLSLLGDTGQSRKGTHTADRVRGEIVLNQVSVSFSAQNRRQRSTTSACVWHRARSWRWWAPRARARQRWSTCCHVSSTAARARSRSTGMS